MITAKPTLGLLNKKSIPIFNKCMENAVKEVSTVMQSGRLVRKIFQKGCRGPKK